VAWFATIGTAQGGLAWQVNVLGLSTPIVQLNLATLGAYSQVHRVVHEDPESIWDPSLQAPPLAWAVTAGAVHGFAWQVKLLGLSASAVQFNVATLGVYPGAHCVVHQDAEFI
jgi:uncharacterized membrane protein